MIPAVRALARRAFLPAAVFRSFGGIVYNQEDRRKVHYRDQKHGYYLNPQETARRIIKLAMMHTQTKQAEIDLSMTFEEMGLDELSYIELMFLIEMEFNIEMPFEEIQKFRILRDTVEYLARSFHAH